MASAALPSLAGAVAVLTRQSGAAAEAAVAQLQRQQPQVASVALLSVAAGASVAQTAATAATGTFDAVVSFNETADELATELQALAPLVKAGGALHVFVADAAEDKKSSILMALMISGFVEAADSAATDGAAGFFPELASGARCFSAKKPSFAAGAALSLAKKPQTAASAAPLPLKKWTVLADEFDEDAADDDDIIDEDTLLDDTDAVLQAAKNDCGPTAAGGKKRACKNCTCGLKDEEDKPVVSDKDLTQMVSSCGNCFKGDAFRCGSCPFLGKPAFKPGMEKVLLNLDADDF